MDELGDDEKASASRIAVCEVIASALAQLGKLLWVSGYFVGQDRVSGESPFQFGDDGAVGIATVCQIGGELSAGAVALLKAGNQYAASALIRQLVEVEYLADAFAVEDEIAAQWLRADRDERRTFWSPGKLRDRANGRFLNTDYWHHCEVGGHPTTRGMGLLPDHHRLNIAYLWVDMAGHLSGIWRSSLASAVRLKHGAVPGETRVREVNAAIDHWHATDGMYAALGDLNRILRDDAVA